MNDSYPQSLVTVARLKSNGWTDKTIQKFLGEPDEFAQNPHYSSAAPMRLYKRERILTVEQSTDEWNGAQTRIETAQAAQKKRFDKFDKKFSTWTNALQKGCEVLFNLDRYVKHESCNKDHREIIYALKNAIIRVLYENGFCTECYHHSVETDERPCFACEGTGVHFSLRSCWKCHGTGSFSRGETLWFVAFRFVVNGTAYSWHQPSESVGFPYTTTHDEDTWEASKEEKPITLSATKFAEAKDLLRWIISKSPEPKTNKLLKETSQCVAA